MTSKSKTVIAFDLYGTLLSTESIAHQLAKTYGDEKAESLAALWRQYQLEYTWRINSMGEYKPFDEITRNALRHAAAERRLTLSTRDAEDFMRSYDELRAFPETSRALELLEGEDDKIEACIFTNGTDKMVANSLRTSPDLAPHADKFKSLITVHETRCYKPDKRTYAHLVEQTGKKGDARSVWVVSANPFDVVGAKAAGLRAAFIDRPGRGWIDRLDDIHAPSLIVRGIDEAVKSILNH
ncbi:haloacid dehalogenase [Biscogniauxia marginata]|nr:haloacid dehalogenase [Biscogniauxia marginata]